MTLGFRNPGTEEKGFVGALDPGNGFDRPVKPSIAHPLPKGEENMNRLAGLNLTHPSLRSTIRQEQIQLTRLRKQDNSLFNWCRAGTKSAKNAAGIAIKPGWPTVPIAKSLNLMRRKPQIRCHAGMASRSKRHIQLGISFSRTGLAVGLLGHASQLRKSFTADSGQPGDPGNPRVTYL